MPQPVGVHAAVKAGIGRQARQQMTDVGESFRDRDAVAASVRNKAAQGLDRCSQCDTIVADS